MQYVLIENVKEGMILSKYIYDNNGTLLLNGNQCLTKEKINSLKNYHICGVFVYSKKLDELEQILYKSNEIVNQLIKKEKLELFSYFQKYHKETYQHSIDVAILSVMMGIEMNFNNKDLYNLAFAALLHDIGKLEIPIEILNKPSKLNTEEYEIIKNHTIFGFDLLKDYNLDEDILNAILQHHENIDGSGYPNHLKNNEISKFAKIIHIVDVYDALTLKRCYKEAMNPSDALEFLYTEVDKSFDIELVEFFKNHIYLYPIGSIVKLSNNKKATIIGYNKNLPTRPIIQDEDKNIINLKTQLNIVITKILN